MKQVIEAAAEVAWQEFEDASSAAAVIRGHQLDLFNNATAKRLFWLDTHHACLVALCESNGYAPSPPVAAAT